MMVGGFLRYVRTFHPHARPKRACFAYSAPAHRAEYGRVFGGLELFDQPFTALVFDRALLNAPSPQHDDDLCEALQAVAERRLQRVRHRTPYAVRVRDFLVREGFPHRTDMQSVARALGMSVRSLRRRLDAEGKAYNEILSEALATTAKRFLEDPRRTIQEIAYDMGFADPNTFSRAFKRWTGMTPSACRTALWAT
jgi:AraC-like DNA-binding protein